MLDCKELLKRSLEIVGTLPQDEQDAMAAQILGTIADEDAWKIRFAEKREIIR
jgi:hypothetical protein